MGKKKKQGPTVPYEPLIYADMAGSWDGYCRVLGVQVFNDQICVTVKPEDDSFELAHLFSPEKSQAEMFRLILWAMERDQRIWVVTTGTTDGCQLVQVGVAAPS